MSHSTPVQPSRRDPLGPLDALTTAALSLFAVALLAFVTFSTVAVVRGVDSPVTLMGLGQSEACVEAEVGRAALPAGDGGRPVVDIDRGEAEVFAETASVCLNDPNGAEVAAAAVPTVGTTALAVGALVLVRRVIRRARRHGAFTLPVAAAVRHLAWLLLVQALVWPFVSAAARGTVLDGATGGDWHASLLSPGLNWLLVIVAVGVLTVGRVLRLSVALQDEVDHLV